MRRFFSFLVGNWPLKVGAIALATVLYGGVVVSENIRTWPGQVPIDVLNPPANAAVLDVLGYVTGIRYRAPLDVASQLTNGSFQASVDLAHVQAQPGGAPLDVAVNVFAIDPRVQIIDFNPPVVRVRIDPVLSRDFPVSVASGIVPEAFHIGPPQVTPVSVTVTGASSRVASIHTITARVTIDASGLNVDQEVTLLALDEQGNEVPGINIEPTRAQVRISVARDLGNATLPVIPTYAGALAPGYRVAAVAVDPVTVNVAGEALAVGRLSGVDTAPIDLTGRTDSFETDVALVAPSGITINAKATVHVAVTVVVSQASRAYEVGLEPTGLNADLLYDFAQGSVLVTLSGPVPALDALDPAQLHATIAVGALEVGNHPVSISFEPPTGVTLVSVAPSSVDVLVSVAPARSPSPPALVSPPASPLASPAP